MDPKSTKPHGMRRKDREVTDRTWMEEILKRGQVVHIAMTDPEGHPYMVTMGYGYRDGALYLHGAREGRKNDILAVHPEVCFQVVLDVEVLRAPTGVEFSMKYRSVTGFGRIHTLTNSSEKNEALAILMQQYEGPHENLDEKALARVWTARLDIDNMTGKCANYSEP
ncbi:MAG: pyridoxamine 5'-phosphate oxidase family protein [Synergistaceae bacterium]|jgi:nitroimidazol reductase NimA-like FMN-containing flavoprotein (pyridoxamine 5'-phosphate oxidase superfamily)|nr:pyridoxamine 5'-phosphate oxidase family protein [Synergistaceae bacterium]